MDPPLNPSTPDLDGLPASPPEPGEEPAAPSSAEAASPPPCANCGSAAPGIFCPECGQERRTRLVSLREMGVDFLDDQLSLNSRLPRTFALLLLRPGFLTEEYLRGRIARYVRPLRLYLGASVTFFLLLAVLDTGWAGGEGGGLLDVRSVGDSTAVDSTGARTGGATDDRAWVDSLQIRAGHPALQRILEAKRREFRGRTPGEAFRMIGREFREHVPTVMFLLLPVYAALLKLLYVRRRRLYVEHFVFALHVHAFAFVVFTLMGVARFPGLRSLLVLWLLVYVFLAMRRVYGQSALRTGAKYLVLGGIYFLLLTLALALTAAVSVLLV